MNSRDAFSEELLSAYLDGQLSVEQVRRVESALAESPDLQHKLQSLQDLEKDLRLLPHYRLGAAAAARIHERTGRIAELNRQLLDSSDQAEEYLNAYLDGELEEDEQRSVEMLLRDSEPHSELLRQLRDMQAELSSLPRYRLDAGFADRVVREAQRQAAETEPAADVRPLDRRDRGGVRGLVWAAVAVAAALALYVGWPKETDPGGVVRDPNVVAPPEDDPLFVPSLEPPATEGDDPSLQLVAALMESSPQEFVLVYDLHLTREGVQQAAFASLLKRHGIGFYDTMPVGPADQKTLLERQFLEGIRIVDQPKPGDEDVQLFLVSCRAVDANAVYMDVMSRPVGIDACVLNLTTRDAGDQIIGRLCDASGVKSNPNQAVELMAGLALVSGAARNIGSFGAVHWIEPSLLTPKPAPVKPGDSGLEGDDLALSNSGEFLCDVLFVVRNAAE